MKRSLNYKFLIISLILLLFGIFFLATLSAPSSLQAFGTTNYYLYRQLISVAIGLVAALIVFKIPLHVLKKAAPWLFFINLVLLVIVFLPALGVKILGARRWISVGSRTVQPSEFLKITAVMYFSSWLSVKYSDFSAKGWAHKTKKATQDLLHVFLPFAIFLAVIAAFLFFQKDLSTLTIIVASLLVIYFAAGTPPWHTALFLLLGAAAAFLLIKIEPYRVQRLLVFLYPNTDPLGIGFQLRQSLLAVGSGGIFGKGWGMSTQKFGFLPAAMSDSVFAIVGEELGLVGCVILISMFVFFFWQAVNISKNATDKFAKLVAIGIATWIIVQAFMNMASAIGMFPLAGIPLPFFSFGGSHLIAELIGVGILLNISKNG